MLDMDAERLSEIVDSGKPGFDAGKKRMSFPMLTKASLLMGRCFCLESSIILYM